MKTFYIETWGCQMNDLDSQRLSGSLKLRGYKRVESELEADLYQQTCLTLLRDLDGPIRSTPEIPLIDRDQHGPIPRVNLSLKLSSLPRPIRENAWQGGPPIRISGCLPPGTLSRSNCCMSAASPAITSGA